jgi:hypothetical protein
MQQYALVVDQLVPGWECNAVRAFASRLHLVASLRVRADRPHQAQARTKSGEEEDKDATEVQPKKAANKSGMVVFSQPVAPESECPSLHLFWARSHPVPHQREEVEGEQDVWYFVSTGDLDKVAALLASGQFTIDQQDDDGRTPLMWAVDKGD